MTEDQQTLMAEARKIATDYETRLETVIEYVDALSVDRARVLDRAAAVKECAKRAREEYYRLLDENVEEWKLREAEREWDRASNESFRMSWYELARDDIDPEHRKAVARQMAGMLRDEAENRLDAIKARSHDPELRSTVAECKEEVNRGARYILNRFRQARDLPLDEVRKARAEAREILDYLENPPVD